MKKHLFHKGSEVGIGDKARGKKLLTSHLQITLCASLSGENIPNTETTRKQKKTSLVHPRVQETCYVLQ